VKHSRPVIVALLCAIGVWLATYTADAPPKESIAKGAPKHDVAEVARRAHVTHSELRTAAAAETENDPDTVVAPATRQVRVFAPDGAPLAEASVYLMRNGELIWRPDDPNHTDANGAITFTDVDAPEDVVIRAHAPRRFYDDLLPTDAAFAPDGETIIRLETALHVRGVVVGPDGSPLRWVPIRVSRARDDWFEVMPRARSDDEGRFDIGALRDAGSIFLAAGTTRVLDNGVHGERDYPTGASVVETEVGAADVRLQLAEGSTLRVTLTGGTVRRYDYVFAVADDNYAVLGTITNGVAFLTGLDPGEPVTVYVRDPVENRIAIATDVVPGGDVTLRLEPAATLEGRVECDEPITPGSLIQFDVLGRPFKTQTDEDGRFSIPALPRITGRLEAYEPRRRKSPLVAEMDATPGTPVVVVLRPR